MSEEKARAIEKRHQHQCSICMLIDSDNKDVKFFVFSEGYSSEDPDQEICEGCLKDIDSIRLRARHKADNPSHDTFKDFMPAFTKDMPGLKEAFRKILS